MSDRRLNLPLSQYKKVAEDAKSATLAHPLGHSITIAKNVLSQKFKEDLQKLPLHKAKGGMIKHYDDGGEVEDQSPAVNLQMPAYDPKAAAYNLMADPTIGRQTKEALAQEEGLNLTGVNPRAQEAPPPETKPASLETSRLQESILTPTQSQQQSGMMPDMYTKGFQEQEAGIRGEAAAQGKLAQQQAQALNDVNTRMQNAADNYSQINAQNEREIMAVGQDLKNGHIDPNRYIGNMSTGGKIATAIGLILGGMGAGIARSGTNPAWEALKMHIDNDIMAQKSQLGMKETYMSKLMELGHSQHEAQLMTNNMMLEQAKNQVQAITAQNQNPLLQARAQQLLGQLHQQQGQYLYQMNMSRMLSNGQLPSEAQAYLPQDLRERAVKLPNNNLGLAASKEDAETVRKNFDAYGELESALQEGHSFNENVGTTIPGTINNASAQKIQQRIAMAKRKVYDIARFSPEQQDYLIKEGANIGGVRPDITRQKLAAELNEVRSRRSQDANHFLMGTNLAPSAPSAAPNLPNLRAQSQQ